MTANLADLQESNILDASSDRVDSAYRREIKERKAPRERRQLAPAMLGAEDPDSRPWSWGSLAVEAAALGFFAFLGLVILWALLTPSGLGH